jgi:hypothetical protein
MEEMKMSWYLTKPLTRLDTKWVPKDGKKTKLFRPNIRDSADDILTMIRNRQNGSPPPHTIPTLIKEYVEDEVMITTKKETLWNGLLELEHDEFDFGLKEEVETPTVWPAGTKVELLGTNEEWVEVKFPDGEEADYYVGDLFNYQDMTFVDLCTSNLNEDPYWMEEDSEDYIYYELWVQPYEPTPFTKKPHWF